MSKYMENAELVMKFFDKNGWGPYNMIDDGCAARFFGEICGFEGLFKSFHFLLFVGDDVVESYVTYPISAKDKILQVSEFITRANYGHKYGEFKMYCDYGDVCFHLAFPMSAVRADEHLLQFILETPLKVLDKYAKGFTDVLMGVKTPEEAIKDCVRRTNKLRKGYNIGKYKENAEFVEKYLDETDRPYVMRYFVHRATFSGEVSGFEGLYNSFRFVMVVDDDAVQNYVNYPISAKDKMPQMAEFITRANYELKYGAFEMDYSNGEVRFHLALPMSAVRADEDLLPLMIGLPPTILDKYAKGFFDVLMGVKTPEEAIKDCKGDGSVELRFRSRGERGHTVKTQKEEE